MRKPYISRKSEAQLQRASEQFPILVLTGPRQTGKSTLLKNIFGDFEYVTFDDPLLRGRAKEDPVLFLENYPSPCILDEIQYVPELLPYLKMAVDEDRNRNGQYVLTGSQIFPLMKGLTESLAGRAAIFELYGISLEEQPLEENTLSLLFDRIYRGSYPDPLIHKVDRNLFYSSYMQTYLERDIRQIQNVQDLSLFQNFLEMLAARAGNVVNFSEISRDLGVSQPTVKRWISLLENSRIIYLLRPFYKNINKRVIKAPKLYFSDTGLLSYLLRYPDSNTLSAGPMNGAVLENFLIMELVKHKTCRNSPEELYFYRDNNGNEIDLVINYGYRQILCEIKMNKTIGKKHYSHMERLSPLFSDPRLFVISSYGESVKLSRHTANLPFSLIHKLLD
ncbi:MAG: ATP-binding protein [Spirochaetales bacterium]|nr:ATP-binding protein [Spirochaetales bacterium]